MHFVTHFTIALISLIAIVLSCILFTNAIEFLGNKLKLGNNATGSILAVIGTGLPEFIVPIVAIFGAKFTDMKIDIASDIALGAILGSPFMLSTLALFLLFFVLINQKRKQIYLDIEFVIRDYKYFILAYLIAFTFVFLNDFKIIAFLILILLYGIFVYRTILKSRYTCVECECEKIYFNFKNENLGLFLQLFISLFILILSSHFFVGEIKHFSSIFGISPSILALLITPFATELPECINSIIWLKQGKDELAIANILGAIVFQTTLLFGIGIALTPWVLNKDLLIASSITLIGAFLFLLRVLKNKKIDIINLFICGILYFCFLIYLFTK